ncbi:MAG: hypothetical protein AB2L12_11865 [Smithellaceae bacterium]
MSWHTNEKLKRAYKGYQGQKPDSAKFIFIGIDANFSSNIDNNQTIFNEILDYLEDGVKYWNKEKMQCPRYRHHPFLSPDYGNGPGYRYHHSFSKMLSLVNITKEYADKISFIELLPFPTCDTDSSQFMKLFNDACYLKKNKDHLSQIDLWINFSENIKAIFIPMGVHTKICELRKQQEGCFDWLPIDWLTAPPKTGKFIRNKLYTSQARTNKSVSVHVITHFSDAISDTHLKDIGKIIK